MELHNASIYFFYTFLAIYSIMFGTQWIHHSTLNDLDRPKLFNTASAAELSGVVAMVITIIVTCVREALVALL